MEKQRTVKGAVSITGIGLQTGQKATVNLKPSPVNSGINFIRVDLPNKPLLNVASLRLQRSGFLKRRTTLGSGPVRVQTTEHLLAALSGLSVDNIVIEIDSQELPGLDGSAKEFVGLIRKAGIAEQDAPKKFFNIDKTVRCGARGAFIEVSPAEEFRISYTLSYKDPAIGTQALSLTVDEDTFENYIAPARTFCLEKEAAVLLKMGLGKGANYGNTLVMGKSGPVRNTLRFSDEPVRHKILDLIGDLYILGAPIRGHVVAFKSGHALNMELVRKLKEADNG